MRALLQRVSEAQVRIDGDVVGACGPGLTILVCAMRGDTEAKAETLAAKVAKCRIFHDEMGKMNRSILDIGGFSAAAPPEEGERLYTLFSQALQAQGLAVQTGRFGADMQVSLVNDGPVTIWIDI